MKQLLSTILLLAVLMTSCEKEAIQQDETIKMEVLTAKAASQKIEIEKVHPYHSGLAVHLTQETKDYYEDTPLYFHFVYYPQKGLPSFYSFPEQRGYVLPVCKSYEVMVSPYSIPYCWQFYDASCSDANSDWETASVPCP